MVYRLFLLCWVSLLYSLQLCGSYSLLAFSRSRTKAHKALHLPTSLIGLAKKSPVDDSPSLAPVKAEFSRIVHLSKVPRSKPVSCRLIAKQTERIALSERFHLGELTYLAANVTLTRQPPSAVLIQGNIIAHVSYTYENPDILSEAFETVLLNNYDSGAERVAFEDAKDCDDEVAGDGNIDVGEIVGEYLSLMS